MWQNQQYAYLCCVLIVQNTEHFRIEKPSIVTIGTFDGVHLGHQKILHRLAQLREETGLQTLVLTFDPHPRKVLFPEQRDLKLLTTIEEKLDLLARYKVDITVVYPFSKAFAELEAEHYIKDILVRHLNTKKLVIGYDHRFGKGRSGDITVLQNYTGACGFDVEEISAKDIDSIAVSSTKIRKAIEDGNLEQATEFLGHPFFLNGRVIKGKQLGRQLGYPTANLETVEEKIVPKIGVYFVKVEVEGELHYGMLNVGTNPTTDHDQSLKIEVHLFEFDRDIYFKNVRMQFIRRIRDEKKFKGLPELIEALHQDKEQCYQLMQALV